MMPSSAVSRFFASSLSKGRFASSYSNIENLINDNILGRGNSPQSIVAGKSNPLSGKIMKFHGPSNYEILSPEYTKDTPFILSCGLGGGSSESNLYDSWLPIAKLLNSENVGVYSSLLDAERRPERFRRGLAYYYDEFYINEEESENFFEKVFKMRFFDSSDKLRDPKDVKPFVLFGFSVAHREHTSHKNYLYRKLEDAVKREGKDLGLVEEYFKKLVLVNIGSPVNWSERRLPKEYVECIANGSMSPREAEEYIARGGKMLDYSDDMPEVKTIGYRSYFDMGTAKPLLDFYNFHCNKLLATPQIFGFIRPNRYRERIYVFGKGLVPELFLSDDINEVPKNNMLGHNLADYASAISQHQSTMLPILTLGSLVGLDLASPQTGIVEAVYNKDKKPSQRDEKSLLTEWVREMERREGMKNYYEKKSHQQGSGR